MTDMSNVRLIENKHVHLKVADAVFEQYNWSLKIPTVSRLVESYTITGEKPSFKTSFQNGIIGKTITGYKNCLSVILSPNTKEILFEWFIPVERNVFIKITSGKLHFLSGENVFPKKLDFSNMSRDLSAYRYSYKWSLNLNCAKVWTDAVDTLRLQFIVASEVPIKWIDVNEELEFKLTNKTSDTQLSKYYLSCELSDVTFQCENETIPAHRLVLSSKSPVFAAMFATNMKKANEGHIKIDDMNPKTLKEFLKIFYNIDSESFNNIEMIRSLLAAADKYHMKFLKDQCEKSLIKICFFAQEASEIKMLIELYNLADLYEAHQLKAKTLDYLIKNKKALASDVKTFTENVSKYPNLMIRLFEG